MNNLAIKQKSETLQLDSQQRAIVVGLLLGDGHLETRNNGKTYRLKIEHSLTQKEYVDWLYTIFRNHTMTEPRVKNQVVKEKEYQKYVFSTLSSGSLRFYGQQFYPKGKKVVPKIIGKLLTPLSVAVWFMDDGSLKSNVHRARIINTQGFEKKDINLLRQVLVNKFQVKSTLRKQKEGWQIYIPAVESTKFIQLVEPYIVPSMQYKIR